MGFFDAVYTGISELFSHKMRSLLTMLGVIFGVAAVISMVSIGEGGKQQALLQIKEMGTDVIYIKRLPLNGDMVNDAEDKSPNGLIYSDIAAIGDTCQYAKYIIPVREVYANVKLGDKDLSVNVVGTTENYDKVCRLKLSQGRFINKKDNDELAKVCVLGVNAKRDLFGFSEAVGKTIKISNNYFKVIGVLEYKDLTDSSIMSAMRNANKDVYIPMNLSVLEYQVYSENPIPLSMPSLINLAYKGMASTHMSKAAVSQIIMSFEDEKATEPTAEVVKRLLNRRHKNIPDYTIVIPAQLIRQAQATQNIFNIVMAAIAGISLLVGGIGIMNIMLATVTQRTREIGIRRCIGATKQDIIMQFMLEALVITCFGGIIGVGLGVLGAKVISAYAGWLTVVSPSIVVMAFSVSVATGLVFGMYPAIKAASINPIEALRQG